MAPAELTADQYKAIREICVQVHRDFDYLSDPSGYKIGDYWNIMTDVGVDKGDCEDFALTKMHRIIEAGIVGPGNMQIILCFTETGERHAVLGIQTLNYGFLIADNRMPFTIGGAFGFIGDKSLFDGYYAFDRFQVAGSIWATVQEYKGGVPIDYMDCNSSAFSSNDKVVIEFTGYNWTQPKVIGFAADPRTCSLPHVWFFGNVNPWISGELYFTCGYFLAADFWEYSAAMTSHGARQGCKATKTGAKILVTGGFVRGDGYPGYEPWPPIQVYPSDCTNCPSNYAILWNIWINDYKAEIYDGLRYMWTAVADYPSPRRNAHGGWSLSGIHYIFGGYSYPHGYITYNSGNYVGNNFSINANDECAKYTISTDAWEACQSVGINRARVQDFAFNGFGFFAGGHAKTFEYTGVDQDYLRGKTDTKKYNPSTDTWENRKSLTKWRYDGAGFAIEGYGYVAGGWVYTGQPEPNDWAFWPEKTVLKFDDTLNTWSSVQNYITDPDHQLICSPNVAAENGSKAYMVVRPETIVVAYGGMSHCEEYDPVLDTWSIKTSHPGYSGVGRYKFSDMTAA